MAVGAAETGSDAAVAQVRLGELAQCVDGVLTGDPDAWILGVSSIEDADEGDIVFAENPRYLKLAARSRASAIVACADAETDAGAVIRVENPRLAFARILALFQPAQETMVGVHGTAVVGAGSVIAPTASVGPQAVLGQRVHLAEGVKIGAGAFVGDDCRIGAGSEVRPNATLYHGSRLGERVVIHSGAVIGADGFGYMRVGNDMYKIPQVGIVEIEDDVEIGANSTVDRAKTGSTVIGARTKVDNLVQIAHNCKIGPDCIVIAQAGIAGSTRLGRGVVVAGQAGLKDHITVGDGAMLLAQSGVIGDVPAGVAVSGYPAREHREKLRQEVEAARLPQYARRLRALEAENAALVARSERLERLAAQLAERLGVPVEP